MAICLKVASRISEIDVETAGFLFLTQEVEFLLESEWLIQSSFVVFPLCFFIRSLASGICSPLLLLVCR
jgi:hypothetical protein